MKFDPVDLFKKSLALGRPGFIDRATWQVEDPPAYVEGDSKKLQRCLVSTIADCCSKLSKVRALTCAIGTKQSHSQGLKHLVRVWFEIHASESDAIEPIDPEAGWTSVQVIEDDEVADRPVALCEELGGEFFRAGGGTRARLEISFRHALDAQSMGSSSRFRAAKADLVLRGLEKS